MSDADLESTESAESASPEAPHDDAAHLLVVDDDNRIRSLLSRYLASRGYRVTTAGDARTARLKMQSMSFDLIVLDAMMPGENGFDFARSLREASDLPILMLTARAETEDRVLGLESGADDYLTKPFDPKELALRVASILRRASPRSEIVDASTACVRFGDFVFRLERAELLHRGSLVRLTDRERAMMSLLAQTPGEVVAREALAGPAPAGNERTIDVQVNRLRRKIEADPAAPLYLQTVRGIGYRLAAD
jgi:two-component system, OmpR family, phosphate regulon response regulator OmpR